MENIKAKIKLMDSFNITGRGLVFAIEILKGDFTVGNQVKFQIENKHYRLKIKSLELINYRPNLVPNLNIMGVIFEIDNTEFQELYHNHLLKDIIAEVI
jgi:hypothetical protein